MKKIILIAIIVSIVLLAALLIIGIFIKLREQRLSAERIKHLPQFSFSTLNKTSFYSSDIKEGPLLIIYFHPECEHCQYEISELFRSKIFDLGITVMLISGAVQDSVISFLNRFPDHENDKLITLIDTASIFEDIFGKAVIPSGYLYNKELSLIDAFYGEYRIETILDRFSDSE